jgi:hypothetical protein
LKARESATIHGRELIQDAPVIHDCVKGTSGTQFICIYAYQTTIPGRILFDYTFSLVSSKLGCVRL